MTKHTPTCPCGNISASIQLTRPLEAYSRRVCDCDYCLERNASYISDPAGTLHFRVKDKSKLARQHQGSNAAEFLVCTGCDTLVGITYTDEGKTYGTVASAFLNEERIKEKVIVSPKFLTKDEKTDRWQNVWFKNVSVS